MERTEERALKYKTSRISYISNYFLSILLVLFFFFLISYLRSEWISIAAFIFFLIILFLITEPEWEKAVRKYEITNNEVVKIEGIITKKIINIPYQSIADVKVFKGVIGRIFNFGNVEIKGIKNDIVMKGVREPEIIGKIIENKISLFKGKVREKKGKK